MPLSDRVYCVAVAFKMTEQVEQWICITFCVKLEHSSAETIWMIQKATAMATDDWQPHQDNTPSDASCLMQFFWKTHHITQLIQLPYSPHLVSCNFWLFPKIKSPWRWKRFQTIDEIQENILGLLMAIGRTV